MVVARACARWARRIPHQSSKAARGSTYRNTWHTGQCRSYASAAGEGGQSTHKSWGDLPWAIASIAVTIPSVYYLIQPQLRRHVYGETQHGHGDPRGKHGKHEEGNTDGIIEGGSSEGEEKKSLDKGDGEEKADDHISNETEEDGKEGNPNSAGSGETASATPDEKGSDNDAGEKDGGEIEEEASSKDATSDGERQQGDSRTQISDANDGSKLKLDGDYGSKQGEAKELEQDPNEKDTIAAFTTTAMAGSVAHRSSEHKRLSNIDIKHSIDI